MQQMDKQTEMDGGLWIMNLSQRWSQNLADIKYLMLPIPLSLTSWPDKLPLWRGKTIKEKL